MSQDDFALIVTDGKWRLEPRVKQTSPMEQAVGIIAATLGMSSGQMLGRMRWTRYARARKICALILREHFGVSRRLIGLTMGGRDQQSIWVALRNGRIQRETDERFRSDYEAAKAAVEMVLARGQ